jgi:hypothetical protein
LKKVADTQDGRAFMVSLSAEGTELVERLKASRGEWFRQILRDWEPGDAEAFGDYLDRFATSFEASKDQIKSITLAPTLAPTLPASLAPTLPAGLAPVTTITSSGHALAETTSKE